MNEHPVVSVIIPLYNAEKYIVETMESILNQTYRNLEIIVVDDCGTDRSLEIVRGYKDKRIKIIYNKVNRGIAYSRNVALSSCTGEYVALLDDDDVAIHTRLEKQVSFLTAHPDIVAVGGNAQWIDENGRIIRKAIKVVEQPEEIKMYLLFRNLFNNSEMTFRKSVIVENHIEYVDNCLGMEDFLFWIKLSKVGKISNLPDIVLLKRMTKTNETARNLTQKERERKQKYLELQKYSLSQSGFELDAKDEQVLSNFFDEKASSCKNYNEIEKLSAFMTKIIVQARKMNVDFCEPLEKWFSELLEWNMDNAKDSYMTAWQSAINALQPQSAEPKEKQNFMVNRFTTDLVLLKEMSKTYIEKEKFLQELLETKNYLEKRCDEQGKYIQELNEGKDWLEKKCEKQEKYIQELTSSVK